MNVDANKITNNAVNTIIIPNGVTNGDVIKAMFPNATWWLNEDNEVFTDMPWKPNKTVSFDIDWWNTKYRIERY